VIIVIAISDSKESGIKFKTDQTPLLPSPGLRKRKKNL
jgi:hypothetical protein